MLCQLIPLPPPQLLEAHNILSLSLLFHSYYNQPWFVCYYLFYIYFRRHGSIPLPCLNIWKFELGTFQSLLQDTIYALGASFAISLVWSYSYDQRGLKINLYMISWFECLSWISHSASELSYHVLDFLLSQMLIFFIWFFVLIFMIPIWSVWIFKQFSNDEVLFLI